MNPSKIFILKGILIGILFISSSTVFGQKNDEKIVRIYKQIDSVQLKMEIYQPKALVKTKKYPTIIFYFGGGWSQGSITQFSPYAAHCVEKGMIAILVDYRVKSRQKTTPIESLKDAKSAMRFLRRNATEFNIDPNRMIASGGSAGGQLAAACFTSETINEVGEDLKISAKPNALVLFNPVIDNSKEGYGYDRVKENWKDFSPLQNINKGFPTTAFFVGTKDNLVPVKTAEMFKNKVDSVGSRCELYYYEDQQHGFFNKVEFHPDIFAKMDAFLKSLGYIK